MTEGRVYKVEFEDPFGMVITFCKDGSLKQIRASGGLAARVRNAADAELKEMLDTHRRINCPTCKDGIPAGQLGAMEPCPQCGREANPAMALQVNSKQQPVWDYVIG